MNKIEIMQSNDINKMIILYNNLRNERYSCSNYGGVFDFYISNKLNIEIRTNKFHKMTSSWITFLWNNDKDNILNTLNKFINNYK